MRSSRLPILIVTLAALLSACTSNVLTELRSKNQLKQLRFYSEANSNSSHAVGIDIVFVYRSDIADNLPQYGSSWFDEKARLQAGYGAQIDVISVEISPLSYQSKIDLPWSSRSASVVLVYSTMMTEQDSKGSKVKTITDLKCAGVTITESNISYEECAK